MQRLYLTMLLSMMVWLAGCSRELVMPLADWQFEYRDRRELVHLPMHLDGALPEEPSTYTLRRSVQLAPDFSHRGLTLAIPWLQGRTRLVANGVEAKFLEPQAESDYRITQPHVFWIPPEVNRSEVLDLQLEVRVESPWAAWVDTVPTLSPTPRGDRNVRWMRQWNTFSTYFALCSMLSAVLCHGILYWWTREIRNIGTAIVYLLLSVYPLFAMGANQALFGVAEAYVMGVCLVGTVLTAMVLVLISEGYHQSWKYAAVLLLVVALVETPVLNPFHGVQRGVYMTIGIVDIVAVAFLVFLARGRRERRRQGQRVTRSYVDRWAMPVGVGIGLPDVLIYLGYGDVFGGWRTASFGMGLAATVSSLALSIQYFEEHKKALELQRSLAERLELLEARTKEVNGLNVELRRQLSANATELASALVKASRSGLGKQLETGDIVDGRYRVGRHLGTGGMGTVFEVQRVSDEKRFAMKVITGKHSSVAVARLAREAENALRVECPSVVGLRDVGTTEDNVLFLVMDLVEGPCLAEEKARFGDTNWCVEVLRQIAEGLAAIHKAGVVHRDIKPRNVLLSYADDPLWPKARIADFGLAAALASDGDESGTADSRGQGLTRTGHVVGTPLYMAPEAHGPSQMVGAPSDIFSLGVLAREILKLETSCFAVPLGMMLAVQHTNEVTPIRKARPELDPVLAEVLDACLALDPSQRPSADQVFQACQGIVPPGSSRGVLGSQSQCA